MPKRKGRTEYQNPDFPCNMDIDIEIPYKSTKRRKTYIPRALKMAVWKTNIGLEHGTALCLVCNVNAINQFDFHCGHITAEAEGGETCLSNLRPVCAKCNQSMGRKNLESFKSTYFH